MPVGAQAGSEQAPVRGRLAGQHGAVDRGEPAVHRLRVLRALDAAGDAVGPGGRGGRERRAVPSSSAGARCPLAQACAPGNHLGGGLHAGSAAAPFQSRWWTPDRAENRAVCARGQAPVLVPGIDSLCGVRTEDGGQSAQARHVLPVPGADACSGLTRPWRVTRRRSTCGKSRCGML